MAKFLNFWKDVANPKRIRLTTPRVGDYYIVTKVIDGGVEIFDGQQTRKIYFDMTAPTDKKEKTNADQ